MDLIGRKIAGRFAIEAFVGGGAMGAVYRARQIELDKVVAIKVLHEKLATEAEFAGRFKREAKAASLIDHPNSMRVIDFGQEPDGLLYIAMELLEGPNLHSLIKTEGPLEPERIVRLGRQILGALAAAHDLEILHRDLKPENVIIVSKTDDEGRTIETVKVCDFGIAKVGSGAASTAKGGKLTSAGSIVGTPDYMSPEQARGKNVDARSDLYSVGVMLYEMMTGQVPFVAPTPLAVVLMHLNDEPVRPSQLNPDVDPHLEDVALKAMAKDPEGRFGSAREMRSALALEGVPSSTTSVPSIRLTEKKKPKALELVPPEASMATSATLVASATDVTGAAPQSRRMTSAAELLAPPPEPPKEGHPATVVIVVALMLLLGGGGFLYWKNRAPAVVATAQTEPSTTSVPSATHEQPLPVTSVVPVMVPSVRASASGKLLPVPSSAPPVVASVSASPSASAPPAASSAAAPALPPSPAHVIVGAITAKDASQADIANALPVAKFNQCYRDGVAGKEKPPTGQAKLHLVILASSTEATFAGPPGFETIGACVSHAAGNVAVTVPPSGGTADVELTFKID